MPASTCLTCHRLIPIGQTRCTQHQRQRRKAYGYPHQQLRQRVTEAMRKGQRFICARCEKQIQPGQPWDLGHLSRSEGTYRGAEHAACNRAAGALGIT